MKPAMRLAGLLRLARPGSAPSRSVLAEAARRRIRAAGWAGALGIGLAGFALSFDLTGNRALEAEADSLYRQARAAQRAQRRQAVPPPSPRAQLDAFLQRIPEDAALPELLVRLHGHAQARGLRTDKADYRSSRLPGSPLEQVSLDLPLKGSYPSLRAWLGDLQAEMPELAIDSLSLRRARIGDSELEARVRIVIYLRRPA